ncbi:tRNA (guanine-N(7)-)-methyltransferase non-catalytic subunit wuho [Aethina tumida]|uniref:tRNA (guanine-N(7)-)-methyltransferase non-catalytic subunit wuho n=1 Tax=Aethina tumida TaxID=116153 RepID=UPI00096B40B1|nr:tRNA (guanine-N(7)-)-methyltransferase non-catalytic subunit wuho [Aethina tumida]
MVVIKSKNDCLVVANKDSLVFFDRNSQTTQAVEIPEPILPENLTKGQIEVLKKEDRTVTSLSFSKNGEYCVVSTENKQVIVFDSKLQAVKNFIVNRAASKVLFTSHNDVIVADKTGDVYLYKLNEEPQPILLLGHLSVVFDVILSECEKYIITCDRDEKIRVSYFPNAYNIVSFCLGHKEFVTTLKIVKNTLISASGDGTFRYWNYLNGKELELVNSNQYIKDDSILQAFSKEMDEEKVDVTALPIIDLQVHENGRVFVAVSIYNVSGIQLYVTDLSCYKTTFIKNIQMNCNISSFFLGKFLYILSDNLYSYKLHNEDYELCGDIQFDDFYKKYCQDSKLSSYNSITAYYKRKFDNVQEYLERKKQRLESK